VGDAAEVEDDGWDDAPVGDVEAVPDLDDGPLLRPLHWVAVVVVFVVVAVLAVVGGRAWDDARMRQIEDRPTTTVVDPGR
jgi:hypothetical protein